VRSYFGYVAAGLLAGSIQALLFTLPALAQMADTGFAGHSSGYETRQLNGSVLPRPTTGSSSESGLVAPLTLQDNRSAPLQLTPFLDVEVVASDNIELRSRSQRRSGIGTQIGGGVIGDYQTERLNAFGTASVLGTLRSRGDNGTISPAVNVNGTTELVQDRLYMDASGDYGVAFGNQGGKFSFSGLGSDAKGYGQVMISPYWRQPIGNQLMSELRYTHQQVFSPDALLAHQMTNAGQAVATTTNPYSQFGAQIMGMYSSTKSDDSRGNLDMGVGMATMRYRISPRTSLLARGGYDYVKSPSLNDRSGALYGVGIDMRPSDRIHTYAMVGRRYNDLNIEMDTSYAVTKQMMVGVSAMHQATSGMQTSFRDVRLSGNQYQGLLGANGEGDPLTAADMMRQSNETNPNLASRFGGGGMFQQGNTFQNRAYISKMVNGYVTGGNQDLTGYALAGLENRDYDSLQDDRVINVMAGGTYEFAPSWTLAADGLYQRFVSNNITNAGTVLGARFGVAYALTPKTSLSLDLSRTEQNAKDARFDYLEHALIAGLHARF
jgi:uncharacterized protein (PEP-CTERM system associated)